MGSDAENPGLKDTPVDLARLRHALGCPICHDVYRFPVTVVRARGRRRAAGGCPQPLCAKFTK